VPARRWPTTRPLHRRARRAGASADVVQARGCSACAHHAVGHLGGMGSAVGGFTASGTGVEPGRCVTLPISTAARAAPRPDPPAARYDATVRIYAALREAVREVEEVLLALQSSTLREPDLEAAAEGFQRAYPAPRRRGSAPGWPAVRARGRAPHVSLIAHSALIELQRERIAAWIALYARSRRLEPRGGAARRVMTECAGRASGRVADARRRRLVAHRAASLAGGRGPAARVPQPEDGDALAVAAARRLPAHHRRRGRDPGGDAHGRATAFDGGLRPAAVGGVGGRRGRWPGWWRATMITLWEDRPRGLHGHRAQPPSPGPGRAPGCSAR